MNEVIYCDNSAIDIIGLNYFDFDSGEKIAVIGCNTEYNLGTKILENTNEYTIKGILTEHISNAINTGVFYCNGNLSKVPTQCSYALVSKNKNSIIKAYNKLESFIKEQNIEIKIINTTSTQFTDYISYTKLLTFLFAILTLFYIILIYVFRHIWLKIKMPEILVLKILGDAHIKSKINTAYFAIWISGFLLSHLIFTLIYTDKCYNYNSVLIVNICILVIASMSIINLYKESKYIL